MATPEPSIRDVTPVEHTARQVFKGGVAIESAGGKQFEIDETGALVALPARVPTVSSQLQASNGTDDTAAVNTILANGGRIRGKPGERYLISAPLVPVSHTELDLTDCTVAYANTGVRCNLIANKACAPTATATDVATTLGSSVIVSPALVGGGAAAGMQVGVVAAGATGGDGVGPIWLYGTIVSVAGNNITLGGNVNGVAASSTLAGATGYLFASRDVDITIIGGVLDGGTNWNVHADRYSAAFNSHLMRLRRLDGYVVSGTGLQLSGFPQGGGWAFGINPGDCTDGVIENPIGYGASTVVQIDGPLKRLTVKTARGQTQDDMVAIGTVGASGNDLEGDITDVVVDGVLANGSWRAVDIFSGLGAHGAQRILRASVASVNGTTIQEGVQITDYAGGGKSYVQLGDVSVTPGAGLQAVANSATYGFVTRTPVAAFHSADSGLLLSSFDPEDALGSFQPTAGFIWLVMLKAPVGVHVANLIAVVKTAGVTLTSGQCLAGIYDPQGNMGTPGGLIAQTADQSATWNATGQKKMALAAQAGYTLDLPGGPGTYYWAAFLANGTTPPFFVAKGPAGLTVHPGFAAPYIATVPGAKHRIGWESAGARTSLLSLNGLSIKDNNLFTTLWAGVV